MVYLLCALAFGVAIAFDRDPPLERASRATVAAALDATRTYVVAPASGLFRDAGRRVADLIAGPARPKAPVAAPHRDIARVKLHPPALPVPSEPVLAAPRAPVVAPPDIQTAEDAAPPAAAPPPPAPSRPELSLAPPPPSRAAVAPADIVRVSMRLKESLTREMFENFSLFLYVSKADTGPWAQHMYVFKKDGSGDLAMLYNWPASTGREKDEIAPNGTRQPSFTPRGYYQLDPARMYKTHFSGQWHEPMPHAMFFNWQHDGLQTGLAIHGAVGIEVGQLGSRASAGCIRIAPQNAALLFNLIRSQYKGLAPRFAFDRRTATMSNDGLMMHDADGNLRMAQGYKVLVFVENYGGENVVAALY
ncbi:MAG: L,D-transpeptidase family protein [Rhizomicrobium sp.]